MKAEMEQEYQQIRERTNQIIKEGYFNNDYWALYNFKLEDPFLIWLESCAKSPGGCSEGYKPARPSP